MAAKGSSPIKYVREVPKSTYEGQEVKNSNEFVERLRSARDPRATEKARERRIFGTEGMRETDLGPEFISELRGHHTELPHRMGRKISRSHDYSCRVYEPSRTLEHAPDCRPCTPMAAYAQGQHRLRSHMMNYVPTIMKYLNDARQNKSEFIPPSHFKDAWQRMKIARKERAAYLREGNVPSCLNHIRRRKNHCLNQFWHHTISPG